MIDAKTKLLAIIGNPVEHSKSPQIHKAFAEMSGDNMIYTAFLVENERLGGAIEGIRSLGIGGVNVTAPYKIEVIKYLDEIDAEAELYGSVNTIVNNDGKLIGYNTDAEGFYRSLIKNEIEVLDKDILIFGAGGATGPVCIRLFGGGARTITVINRTKERAEKLKEYVKAAIDKGIKTERELSHYDIVINTTSAGMHPNEGILPYEDLKFIDSQTSVVDMIYNPCETAFLKRAKAQGAKTLNGLGMLIYQGIIAYELFSGHKLSENAYSEAEKAILGKE